MKEPWPQKLRRAIRHARSRLACLIDGRHFTTSRGYCTRCDTFPRR